MEKISRSEIRSRASSDAIVFGLISGSYIFISQMTSSLPPVPASILNIVLWVAKFAGCIWLMKHCMERLCSSYQDVTSSDTRMLGIWIAIFSAIITGVAGYVAVEYAFPDMMKEQMDAVYGTYGNMLDSNSRSLLETMENNMGWISFISNLLWCTIYGSILSFILSTRIPDGNPFASSNEEEPDYDEN